jgi:uncharacterized protein (DUF433 family)
MPLENQLMLTIPKPASEPSPAQEPLVRKTPGVMGGDACIRSSRIPVWSLVRLRQLGMRDATIRTHFIEPLSQDDLNAAWDYAAAHSQEIEQAIQENEAE